MESVVSDCPLSQATSIWGFQLCLLVKDHPSWAWHGKEYPQSKSRYFSRGAEEGMRFFSLEYPAAPYHLATVVV